MQRFLPDQDHFATAPPTNLRASAHSSRPGHALSASQHLSFQADLSSDKIFISASLCLPSSCVCYADDDVIILGLGLWSAPLLLPSRLLVVHGFVLAILSCLRSLGCAVTCFVVLLLSECSLPPVLTEAFSPHRPFSSRVRLLSLSGSTACPLSVSRPLFERTRVLCSEPG